jgi:hypothetical protein
LEIISSLWFGHSSFQTVRLFSAHIRLFSAPSPMNQILIIVPTVNERENLPRMAQKLLSLPVAVDMLVVDGNSSDGTGKIADELAAKHPQIHVLQEQKKNGLGRAYISGFQWALERGYVSRRREKPGRRPCAGLALFRRHTRRQLAAQTIDVEPLRGHLRQGDYRNAVHRPDGRLQMFPTPRA